LKEREKNKKMRTLFLIVSYLVSLSIAYGQVGEKVIIYKFPQKVPEGKVWKIERGKKIKIQVDEGTLNSGTFCNAMFLSRPGFIYNINKGDIYNAQSFGIIIKYFEKVPYTNDITFSIVPTSLIDKNFELSELQTTAPENLGMKEIVFHAGETVFVGNCLESIEVNEYDMTKEELAIENIKKLAIAKYPSEELRPIKPGNKLL
jgi:hypothetical protein